MELLLIRHAQPARVERVEGPADPPLTELGSAQASAMAEWVASGDEIDALYVSPMRRARETCAPLEAALGLTAEIVDGVAEFDRRHHTYIPVEDMKTTDRDAWQALLDGNRSPKRLAWRDRTAPVVQELVDANPSRKIAVVCHGGVINAYLSSVLSIDEPMFFEPYYTGVNRVRAARSGERSVVTMNECPWLRELGGPYARDLRS